MEKKKQLFTSRKWIRRGVKSLLFLSMAAAVVAALGYTWLNSDSGRSWVVGKIGPALASRGSEVDIRRIRGNPLSRFRLEGISVRDKSGVWLFMEQVEISWRPFAILTGAIEVKSLTAGPAVLTRLPLSTPGNATSTGSAAPTIRLGELSINFSTPIGAPAGNEPIAYRLDGHSIELSGDVIRFEVSLAPVANMGDEISMLADWRRGSNELKLDGTLRADRGGVLEGMFGLQAHTPINASIEGTGSVSSWDGKLNGTLGSGWALRADLEGRGDNLLGVNGQLEFPAITTPLLNELLGSQSSVSGELMIANLLQPSFSLQLGFPGMDLSLKSPEYSGVEQLLENLAFTLDIPELHVPLADDRRLTFAGLTASGAVTAGPDRSVLAGQYRFQSMDSPQIGLQAAAGTLSGSLAGEEISVHLDGAGNALVLALSPGQEIKSETARWDIDGQYGLDEQPPLLTLNDVKTDWLSTGGTLQFDKDFAADVLSLSGSLDSRVFAPVAKLPQLAGQAEFSLVYDWAGGTHPQLARLQTTAGDMRTGLPVLDLLLGPEVVLAIEAETLVDESVALKHFDLKGNNLLLGVSGKISANGQLALDYVAEFNSLTGFLPDALVLEGPVVATGQLGDNYKNPSLAVKSGLDHLELLGASIDQLAAELSLVSLFDNPRGRLNLAGQTAWGELNVASNVTMAATGDIGFAGISADLSALSVTGDLAALAGGGTQGALKAVLKPLDQPGRGLQGKGELAVRFDTVHNAPEISFETNLQHIRIRNTDGFNTDIAQLIGHGSVRIAESVDAIMDLQLDSMYRGALALDQVSLKAAWADHLELDLTGSGHFFEPFTFQLQSRNATHSAAGETVPLHLEAAYGGQTIRTEQPVTVLISDATRKLDIPALLIDKGLVTGFVLQEAGDITGKITLKDLDAVFLTLPWRNVVSSGTVGGTAAFGINAEGEYLDAKLNADNLRQHVYLDVEEEPYSIEVSLAALNGFFEFQSTRSRGSAEVGRLGASFHYSIQPELRIDRAKPITGVLAWDGPVDPLWDLTGLDEHDLVGHLEGEISVSGNIDQPVFSGAAALTGGVYSYPADGFYLDDLAFVLRGAGNSLHLSELTANDGGRGSLTANGSFSLAPGLQIFGNMDIGAKELRFINLDQTHARGTANLNFQRSESGSSLSGKLVTHEVVSDISQDQQRSVVSIEVTEINLPEEGNQRPGTRIAARSEPVRLDLDVDIPRQLQVHGRGLESEWKGSLDITGTVEAPLILGTLELAGGQFEFGGKRFALQSGRLYFDGGRDIDPDIEIVSRTRTASIDAEIIISGKLSSPQLIMSSTPILPEDEILSQLLFGSSVSELGGLQIAELASALATVSGKGSGINFLSAARKTIGLDKLSITAASESEDGSLITGGKRLTDDIYVEVESATATGEVITRMLYDINNRLKVESEVGQEKGSSLKLKWFWDY